MKIVVYQTEYNIANYPIVISAIFALIQTINLKIYQFHQQLFFLNIHYHLRMPNTTTILKTLFAHLFNIIFNLQSNISLFINSFMSSFRNTFEKEESKHLQYDNTAFLHFIISFAMTGAVIFFLTILNQIFFNAEIRALNKNNKNPLFKNKIEKEKTKLNKRFKSNSFIFKIACLIIFIIIFFLCIDRISSQPTKLKGFDPYQLLGVQYDTPPEKIKKAYRKLALLLHPDRNPNNPEAATKFMLISKAYQCLTDEKVKENCKKYGNPEGHQAFNVGIALPSILLQQQNQILVMASIFALLLIIIPKIFINWNNRLELKDERGISTQNYEILYKYLKKKLKGNKVMLMLCRLKQAQHQNLKGKIGILEVPPQQKKIDEITDSEVQDSKQEQKDKQSKIRKIKVSASTPQNVLGIINFISKKDGNSLIVQKMPELLRQAIYFSLDFCTRSPRKRQRLYPNQQQSSTIQFLGMGQLETIISWGQIFYQAAPNYTENGIETLSINKQQYKLINQYKLRDLIKKQEVRERFLKQIAVDRRSLVESQIKTFPNINLKVQSLLDDQPIKVATQRDTVLVKITIDKLNPNSSLAYLKYYPNLKNQIFYLTIQAHNTLMYFEQLKFEPNQGQIVIEYKYNQPPNDQEMNFIGLIYTTHIKLNSINMTEKILLNFIKMIKILKNNKKDILNPCSPQTIIQILKTLNYLTHNKINNKNGRMIHHKKIKKYIKIMVIITITMAMVITVTLIHIKKSQKRAKKRAKIKNQKQNQNKNQRIDLMLCNVNIIVMTVDSYEQVNDLVNYYEFLCNIIKY